MTAMLHIDQFCFNQSSRGGWFTQFPTLLQTQEVLQYMSATLHLHPCLLLFATGWHPVLHLQVCLPWPPHGHSALAKALKDIFLSDWLLYASITSPASGTLSSARFHICCTSTIFANIPILLASLYMPVLSFRCTINMLIMGLPRAALSILGTATFTQSPSLNS